MISPRLIFEDSSGSFQTMISEDALNHMFLMCDAGLSRETGGILIGSYSSSFATAHVTEATSPPTGSKFGRSWFHRGTSGLKELLIERWQAKPCTHYVGEWHFHTAGASQPSPEDEKQMHAIANNARYDCACPLLVIVCPARTGKFQVSCSVFLENGRVRELRIVGEYKPHEVESNKKASPR